MRKKILFLAPEFPPAAYTGSIRVSKFAKYMARFGNDVMVISVNAGDRTHEDLSADLGDVNVIELRSRKIPWINDHGLGYLVSSLLQTRKIAKQFSPDIVYVSGPPFLHFLQGVYVAQLSNARLVLDYRDLWCGDPYAPKTTKSKIFRFVSWPLEWFVLKRAVTSNYISKKMYDDQCKLFPFLKSRKTSIVETGFDLDDLHKINQTQTKLNFIAHVGNADRDMNLRDLIGLFDSPKVKNWFDRTGCRFHFVGKKNNELRSLLSKELEIYFKFTEYLPHLEAMQIMAESKAILILGSNSAQRLNRKVFEATALNSNIFYIGNVESPTAKIIKKCAGTVADANNCADQFMTFVSNLSDEIPKPLLEHSKEVLVRKFLDDTLSDGST